MKNTRMMQLLLALVALVAAAAVADGFIVTGEVYCDPCRAGFKTNVSTALGGAAVKLECRPFLNGPESLKADATTNAFGWYRLEVDQDLQEDICEVMLVKSPDPACSEVDKFRDRARIPLTKNDGIKQNGVRYGNPIAFLRKEPLKECGAILQQYDLKDAPETP
ncbi:hypothetical protein PR202_gb27217 [Eleusine coracana subsp. coracana]|uniref:Pollen allergen Phl p 11 n=1 Tax=Eleusine coracana subsp. coracana TaxID=191504 RepID=A0AAV5FTW0_ELECO|nr:hypothetical protein PR202_gb27217 [Eleusine coracana subsp. coracana]